MVVHGFRFGCTWALCLHDGSSTHNEYTGIHIFVRWCNCDLWPNYLSGICTGKTCQWVLCTMLWCVLNWLCHSILW